MNIYATTNAYHDFIGEEVGECWDSLFANIDLHVDGQVLKPHFYCWVLNPNSTKKNILRN